MPFPTTPTTPTLKSLYNGPSARCGISDFKEARSKFINFARVTVNMNHYNRNK